jgi:hypothetical protein
MTRIDAEGDHATTDEARGQRYGRRHFDLGQRRV